VTFRNKLVDTPVCRLNTRHAVMMDTSRSTLTGNNEGIHVLFPITDLSYGNTKFIQVLPQKLQRI
jgi:hypothetical protein